MKRVPSIDRVSAQPGGLWHSGAARCVYHQLRSRLSNSTFIAAHTALSWSSYVAKPKAQASLVPNVSNITRQFSKGALQVLNSVAGVHQLQANSGNLSIDLDYRPELSTTHEIICWMCAAIITYVIYWLTAPAGFNIIYAACMGLLFGLLAYSLRNAVMEDMYKVHERIEADLGDQDSRFRTIDNLSVHVKVKASKDIPAAASNPAVAGLQPQPDSNIAAVHCYHGFGSNTWSWSLVQQQLADRLGALVTAHDMPGFGLTQRPKDLSNYFLAFNGRLGRLASDYELSVRGLLGSKATQSTAQNGVLATAEAAAGGSASQAAQQAVQQGLESPMQATAAAAAEGSLTGVVKGGAAAVKDAATGSGSSSSSGGPMVNLTADSSTSNSSNQSHIKRVLMGHSMGGACVALEYLENPQDYAALILVAPAVIAKLTLHNGEEQDSKEDAPTRLEKLKEDIQSSSSSGSNAALDALAAVEGNLTRTASADDDSSSTAAAAALAAGDLVYYATRGDKGSYEAMLQLQPQPKKPLFKALQSRVLKLVHSFTTLGTVLFITVMRPVIIVFLRNMVRSRSFWANSLSRAYYDKSKVTTAAVDAYRMPQLVKGWEAGMVQFLLARLGAGGSKTTTTAASAVGAAPAGGLQDAGLAARLAAAVAQHNTPVLVVHGAADALVPASNSFHLARMLKDCRLAIMKKSGHCPQEEEPELFADVVAGYLKRHVLN